jgi:hypothetical protein
MAAFLEVFRKISDFVKNTGLVFGQTLPGVCLTDTVYSERIIGS